MFYTENEEAFWKCHSMGCGYRGDFKRITPIWPGDPVKFECPECGSEYRPEQEHDGEHYPFAGDSVGRFGRATDAELIEELFGRGYKVSLNGVEITEERLGEL